MIRPSDRIAALVSGYAATERATRLLALFQAYTDDSGRGDRAIFCLAGFVSTAPRWAEFSDEWQGALGRLRYFKAKEAAALQGQFLGILEKERDAIVARLCQIVIKHMIYGVRGVVDVRAWEKIALGRYGKPADFPYAFLCNDIMCSVMNEQYHRGLAGKVDFIFDTQSPKEFQNVIEGWTIAKTRQLPRPHEAMPKFHRRRMGQPPICLDDKLTMPLQAADLLAWTSYRSFSDTLVGKQSILVEVIASEFDGHPIMTNIWNERRIKEYFDLVESLGWDAETYRQQFRPTRRQRRRMDQD